MENKIFYYARVSTKEQNLDRQIEAFKKYADMENIAFNDRDIITDKASGKDFQREGFMLLKNSLLRSGDTLVIKELDRLGRDMAMIKDEWNELLKRGVNIVVIDTQMLNTRNKNDLEKSLISNIVFELLTYMAEKERIKIKSRQKEGINMALKKGVTFGRPKAEFPNDWKNVYETWKSKEITAVKAMELLELKKTTFYKLVAEYESQ